MLTADLLEGALPLEAAREAAEALLAAASAAAVAAAGLAGSWGRPAGAAAAAVTDCGSCRHTHITKCALIDRMFGDKTAHEEVHSDLSSLTAYLDKGT